jgi:hypothetical protein
MITQREFIKLKPGDKVQLMNLVTFAAEARYLSEQIVTIKLIYENYFIIEEDKGRWCWYRENVICVLYNPFDLVIYDIKKEIGIL